LTKKYSNNTIALSSVSLDIEFGQIYGIIGPNGAGKTTLFRIIAGQILADTGSVTVHDEGIIKDLTWLKKYLALCPQTPIFYPQLTVKENLYLFSELYHYPPSEYAPMVQELIEIFELKEKINARAMTLSGGQMQRLSLMIVLLKKPKILILDEPTAGLDAQSRKIIFDYLNKFKKPDTLVLYSTHNYREVQLVCDKLAILLAGKVVVNGEPESFLHKENRAYYNLDVFLTSNENGFESIKEYCANFTLKWNPNQDFPKKLIQMQYLSTFQELHTLQKHLMNSPLISHVCVREMNLDDFIQSFMQTNEIDFSEN